MAESTSSEKTASLALCTGEEHSEWRIVYRSPFKLLLIVGISLFVYEALIMAVIRYLPAFPEWVVIALDPLLLLILISPTLYFFFLKPLRSSLSVLRREEDEICALNEQCGQMVLKRTAQLEEANHKFKAEIEKRKLAEKSIYLLQGIILSINKAKDLNAAFIEVVEKICEFSGWVVGEVWLPQNGSLQYYAGWSRGEGLEDFCKGSKNMVLHPGVGLQWSVWQSKKPARIEDAASEHQVARKELMQKCGIKSAVCIPITANDEVLAVMDFLAFKARAEDERLMRFIAVVAAQFAPVIKNKRFHDQLTRANQELLQLDRIKSDFITTVSHELRTPLAMIREGVVQVAEGLHGELKEQQKNVLDTSLRNIERIGSIVDKVVMAADFESGSITLQTEVFDLVELAKGVVAYFLPQAREKELEIKASFSKEKIELIADKNRLMQVFISLVSNAIKFTDKGSIEIQVVDKDGVIECLVKDTGKGIPQEALPKIFDKFFQYARVCGAGEKGVGLGLAIAKSIVEQHNGKMWVESELNQGASFGFWLPKAKA